MTAQKMFIRNHEGKLKLRKKGVRYHEPKGANCGEPLKASAPIPRPSGGFVRFLGCPRCDVAVAQQVTPPRPVPTTAPISIDSEV